MARDAVLKLLRDDAELASLGGTGFVIEPNYTGDQRLNDNGAFVVIRWQTTDTSMPEHNGPHHFDLWFHIPMSISTVFDDIDKMIDRVDDIFDASNDTNIVGADGKMLNYVEREGRGPDFKDSGYQTICRSASYKAFSCKVP